ncbi:MAG: amino acid permease [Thiotrichales bacterium]|nr:MAG: amino acid permease [Thiotrichales bacterium]
MVQFQRSISTPALLFASISAILGSGWLFGSYYAATLAGPSALVAWGVGGLFAIIIAFVFAEICTLLPVTGSSVRIPQFTHGSVVSFLFAWIVWLSYVGFIVAEVQAVIQYASFYYPALTTGADNALTVPGYGVAMVTLLLVSIINTYSVRWLIRSNNVLTVIKLLVPAIIVAVIFYKYFSVRSVFHPAGTKSFMPNGVHGIFAALSTGGIIFAFNGFKQAAEIAGEAKNPSKALPIAIIGSVVICLVVFVFLQMAFLMSLKHSNILIDWKHLTLLNNSSPLSSMLKQDQLSWLLPCLYVGAIIAPLAAGLMYCTSSSRSLYAMSENGYLPKFLQKLTKGGMPITAIIVNFFIALCLFAPLPGWKAVIDFMTSLLAITYASGPVCLLALRKQLSDEKRAFKLPFHLVWSGVAFYICTLLAYWSGWHIISKMGIAIFSGMALLLAYHIFTTRGKKVQLNWKASIWLWVYILGITVLSYLGNYGGGIGFLSPTEIFIVTAIFCVIILYLSVAFCLPSAVTKEYVKGSLHTHI